jgi:glycosyltransferase involved in cell wall biosynthesis
MKKLSIVTPCYNEQDNVLELYERIRAALSDLPYEYEHIFIDNCSTDATVKIIKSLALNDKRVKAIINTRNFGHIRSPYYGMLQGTGDAVIVMASDLQDPPEKIADFVKLWEDGFKVVIGIKTKTQESQLFYLLRTIYYRLIKHMSNVDLIEHFTGFGLYDQQVIKTLRSIQDYYPYVRGLVAEIGYPIARIEFTQPARKSGITKNNFFTLYDLAMLGMTSHTKVPIRVVGLIGFFSAIVSFLIAIFYLGYKLLNWQSFTLGLAPIVIGLFFFVSIQLIFLGVIGEYIGAIHTQMLRRPLVVEQERINFDNEESGK